MKFLRQESFHDQVSRILWNSTVTATGSQGIACQYLVEKLFPCLLYRMLNAVSLILYVCKMWSLPLEKYINYNCSKIRS
jgi:hypothetical protein